VVAVPVRHDDEVEPGQVDARALALPSSVSPLLPVSNRMRLPAVSMKAA
jgi:hypothetical protein